MDILREARSLIENPEHWTQRSNARNKNGDVVGPKSTAATCWCINGAVQKVSGNAIVLYTKSVNLLSDAARGLFGTTVGFTTINDEREHEDVLRLIDKAIELAEKKP